MRRIITISGNIGTGKTTLLKNISKELSNVYTFDENAEENLYLADYFANMEKWAYHSRIAFLQQKLSNYLSIETLDVYKYFILDRGFDELQLFANHLNRIGILNDRDYKSYMCLANTVSSLAKPSDLIIYLYCNPKTSLERILNRGNLYEQNINLEYIELLFDAYENWIVNYKNVVRINTDENYDIQYIIENIKSRGGINE